MLYSKRFSFKETNPAVSHQCLLRLNYVVKFSTSIHSSIRLLPLTFIPSVQHPSHDDFQFRWWEDFQPSVLFGTFYFPTINESIYP